MFFIYLEDSNEKGSKNSSAQAMDIDDELTRLRELERRTFNACNVCSDAKCLESVLDSEYMRLRMSIVDTFTRVAFQHTLRWETVEYAIAWIDVYRVRDKLSTRLPVYLAAIACLSLAIKYTTVRKIKHRELVVQYVRSLETHWKSVTKPHRVEFTGVQIAAAEYHVAAALDWTMGAAIPSRFLEVFFAQHMHASNDAAEGGDAGFGLWTTAKQLCKLGTFHGLSCAHGDSVLAAACIATARCLSNAAQAAVAVHEAELTTCVLELTRVHNAPATHSASSLSSFS